MQAFRLVALAGLMAGAAPAWSANYSFDVLYLGNGDAELVVGSDDPRTTTLWAGDSFDWTISALPGHRWTVLEGGTVFALMAFETQAPAVRTSDSTLTLSSHGAATFSLVDDGAVQSMFHMGTNSVTLPSKLVFDRLHLQYTLLTAFNGPDLAMNQPAIAVGSSPYDLLPFYGMLDDSSEDNTTQTIYGPVPEPATWALWLLGLGAAGLLARRRTAA